MGEDTTGSSVGGMAVASVTVGDVIGSSVGGNAVSPAVGKDAIGSSVAGNAVSSVVGGGVKSPAIALVVNNSDKTSARLVARENNLRELLVLITISNKNKQDGI